MAKPVCSISEVQRVMAVPALFWGEFAKEVKARGGTAAQLNGATPEQLQAAAQAAARAFVVHQEPRALSSSRAEFLEGVDYGHSLNEHVRNGLASSYALENLTDENFPRALRLGGIVFSRYVLLGPYGHKVSSDRVLVAANALDLHRPTPEETLVVGRAHRDLTVVGMVESPWIDPDGDSCVPVVVRGCANLFGLLTGDWFGDRAFLFRM